MRRVNQSVKEARPSCPNNDPCTRSGQPSEEMLRIFGADWLSRRGGTCRLHAIHMNQLCIHIEKVREIVKYKSTMQTRFHGIADKDHELTFFSISSRSDMAHDSISALCEEAAQTSATKRD